MSNILPGKFDGSSDLATWLREFHACGDANGWKTDEMIKKLPAFLRGPAASHFYAIPEDNRKTFEDAIKGLTEAMCPHAQRENFYQQFESRLLRQGEDPAVYKWELEQTLKKADPSLNEHAKEALLSRQFMRGLPKEMKIKLLESDPTPNLTTMLSFVRRYRAVQGHMTDREYNVDGTSTPHEQQDQISQLVAMVKDMAIKQRNLEEALTASTVNSIQSRSPGRNSLAKRNQPPECYSCGRPGHIARDCKVRQQESRKHIQCYACKGFGHISRECTNNLNGQGVESKVGRWSTPKFL